jgi:hypothetical protein
MRRALALCLLLAACGMKEPEQEREKKTIASWEASLALAAEGWTRGELPKHFVRNAAEAATEELSKEKNAARAVALAHDLQDAVEHDDRAAAARIAGALEKDSR